MGACDNEFDFIRILNVDGADAYRAMHRADGEVGLSIKDARTGKAAVGRFRGVLDASLDTEQLRRVYAAHRDEMHGKFNICKGCTTAVVNVVFHTARKEYYNKGRHLFVKDGYDASYDDLTDHVLVRDIDGVPTLIAIDVSDTDKRGDRHGRGEGAHYRPVETPVFADLLGKYFEYDPEKACYRVKYKRKNGERDPETAIPTVMSRAAIRGWLYEHGFTVDGIRYVRYKRSAGSSREGQCLFIAEPLYEDMMRWSSCGLDGHTFTDQASWQAYIALTLSSIEKKIHIPRKAILLVEDKHSVFTDTIIRVRSENGTLTAEREECEIRNKIWDGEALLDESVFTEYGLGDKGMMLLRNRFFKTCAFNTRLTKWFSDRGITRIDQLNGVHTRGATLKDIRLVITDSSLKYLKFRPEDVSREEWLERWLDNVYESKDSSYFGVVKTDKQDSGKMGARLVNTNYQLINTVGLTRAQTAELLRSSFDFLAGMQREPMMLRYHTGVHSDDADDIRLDVDARSYRHRIIVDVMRCTDRFERTPFYRDYRTEQSRTMKERIKDGRILVNGSYHTLFGNGMELLECIVDKNYKVDQPSVLSDGEIYTSRFADGEELLCARSPHITMGNLLVATNRHVRALEEYFNLGTAHTIVCVNAIRSNLQHRLNGCDYDSDTMLITNDPTLLDGAVANYAHFAVPVSGISSGTDRIYTDSPSDLCELDVAISDNRIGDIINLSQFLNSLYWDGVNRGKSHESLAPLYGDICKLAVLSGLEIDKAKRPYPVSADRILDELGKYKDPYRYAMPDFFNFITGKKPLKGGAELETAMAFVYGAVENDAPRAPRTAAISYTELFDLEYVPGDPTGMYTKRVQSVIDFISERRREIRRLNYKLHTMNRAELKDAEEEIQTLFTECREKVEKLADDHLYYLLLKRLDEAGMRDPDANEGDADSTDAKVSSSRALLFASMLYANGGYLLSRLHPSEHEMLDLVFCEDPESYAPEQIRMIYGYPHVAKRSK